MSQTKETRTIYRITCDACDETEQVDELPKFRFAWQPNGDEGRTTMLDVCRECQAKHTGEALRELLSSPKCRVCGTGYAPGRACGPCAGKGLVDAITDLFTVKPPPTGKPTH